MASSTTLCPFLSIFAFALLATAYAIGFSVELIHHDHPRSPSYNPTLSPSDRIQAEIQRSNARAALLRTYFSHFHNGTSTTKYPYPSTYSLPYGTITANAENNYFMSIRLGTPIKEIITVADTGSDLIWVGCEPLFVGFPGVAFGCTHNTNGTSERMTAGIVGLGGGPLSLVSQLGSSIGHRFSYCLVPITLTKVMTSRLSFGSDAIISGGDVQTTNMVDNARPNLYLVTLHGITVGKNNSLGPIKSSDMLVESGSTLISLPSTILESLVEVLKQSISLPQVEDNEFPLCFNESARSDFVYPDITLQLGTATVTLKPYNTFLMKNNHVRCLAMKPSIFVPILGNIAQQNFHVGFDLASWKISFAAADCTKY
ncbi:hypothetical protein LUZ63_010972 [Rhynchospora breviuscula]|uniref:Peptidase A1 domain-containing protein n=1 Tax=Rhynchospora breviuscula TaxID=2022672 RepID=A0A9Q0HQ47_9POAL|nr:hypothetical protein LUZ63_010972 [Rhynchospora breviuscula]